MSVRVTDNGTPALSDTKSFTVVVSSSDQPPVANTDTFSRSANKGTKFLVSAVLANDTDDLGPVTFNALILPATAGGTAVLKDGFIVYTPPGGSDPALDTFQYSIRDSAGQLATGTIRITLSGSSNGTTLNVLNVTGGFPNPAIVKFAGIPGRTYTVQSKDSLVLPWTTLGTALVGANGIGQFTDNSAATAPIRYYRIIEL